MEEPISELPPTAQPEAPVTPRASEVRPSEQPIGQGEQKIVDRIDRDGDPDQVLQDIAGATDTSYEAVENPSQQTTSGIKDEKLPTNEGIINMVQGPDGKWTARDPKDPNFFHVPQPGGQTESDNKPQGVTEGSGAQKPKDFWEQWQASESQRDAQYQKFSQAANEVWTNFQQQTNQRPEFRTQSPQERPLNWEGKPHFAAGPENPGHQENLSPRDRWQRIDREKQEELQNLQAEGEGLASLVYTPEGQQQIDEIRVMLTQIVETTSSKPALETVHPGFDRSPSAIEAVEKRNEQLLQAWQQTKDARVDRLLRGMPMTNLEERDYLTKILGHEPYTTSDMEEKRRRELLLDQFDGMRNDIGKALMYQMYDSVPVEQRWHVVSESELKRNGLDVVKGQELFAKGWDTVKLRIEDAKTNVNASEQGQSEVVGGLVEQNENGLGASLGGLSSIDENKDEANIRQPETEFDPLTLLSLENMPVEDFFALDRDRVYSTLHRLQSLPDDNPTREKAIKILGLIEEGKDKYMKDNPNLDSVIFET